MKAVKISIGGGEYCLAFNGAAMFEIEEKYEGAAKLLDALNRSGKESFQALCWTVALLAEQGELVRRFMGHSEQALLTEAQIRTLAAPADVVELKRAVVKAIMLGYGRQVEGDGEVDLGLAELDQKKRKR